MDQERNPAPRTETHHPGRVSFLGLRCSWAGSCIGSRCQGPCGPDNIKLEVHRDSDQHPMLDPASGKAILYIAQDFPGGKAPFHFNTRVGMDGVWIGAAQNRSYFGVLIDPGVHHLCVSGGQIGSRESVALHRLDAKAGEIYYCNTRFRYLGTGNILIDLDRVDEDKASS